MIFTDISIEQLQDELKNKKLVCFGGGRVLQNFFADYAYLGLLDCLYGVLDNHIHEEKISVCGSEKPILTIQDLLRMENVLIMISCAAIGEIYKQLSTYDGLKNVPFCIAYFVRRKTAKAAEKECLCPDFFKKKERQLIPKKIHYCWFGKGKMPENYVRWMQSWKKYCPDYEIIRWDESNYDISKNAYMYEAYRAGQWAFVSDYARIDVVNQYGGIYLDTDVELVRNLDDLLFQPGYVGVDTSDVISLGLGFGAYAGHKILEDLLELYAGLHFQREDGTYDLTPCPNVQRGVFQKHGYRHGQFELTDGMKIYPHSVLAPQDLYTGEINITKYTFSIHHYAGSWGTDVDRKHTEDNYRFYQLLKNREGKKCNYSFGVLER